MTTGFFACASTGCTCCRNENRAFGPYRTKEEAQARNDVNEASKQWASQYAKAGRHSIVERDIEELPDGRLIIGGDWIKADGWATLYENDDDWKHPDDI